MLPASIFLVSGWFAFARSQPVFPDGVAPLLKSVSERQGVAMASAASDADKVNALKRSSSVAVQEDLMEEVLNASMSIARVYRRARRLISAQRLSPCGEAMLTDLERARRNVYCASSPPPRVSRLTTTHGRCNGTR